MTATEKTNIDKLKQTIAAAANIALTVIHFNGATTMADKAFRNVISTTDFSDYNIIWRLDYILIKYNLNGETETLLKPVVSVGTNLTNSSKVIELSESVKKGRVAVSDVDSELRKILAAPLIHKQWVYILLDGLAAAFYLKFHHGDLTSILIVLVAAMIGETIRYLLQARIVQVSRITFICGIISAGITSIILHFGYGQVDIITLIASVIYLVPGLRMINGFIDFTDERYIYIGMQRLVNAMFLFLILAVVILMAFTITKF